MAIIRAGIFFSGLTNSISAIRTGRAGPTVLWAGTTSLSSFTTPIGTLAHPAILRAIIRAIRAATLAGCNLTKAVAATGAAGATLAEISRAPLRDLGGHVQNTIDGGAEGSMRLGKNSDD